MAMCAWHLGRNDEADSGLVINQKGIGLRLSAMEYWKCGESGLSLPGGRQNEPGCKFVLAESLPDQGGAKSRANIDTAGRINYMLLNVNVILPFPAGSNQVNTFLEEHRAAGVQHIGLYTGDIVEAVRDMADAGVRFFSPPPAYYTEVCINTDGLNVLFHPSIHFRPGATT